MLPCYRIHLGVEKRIRGPAAQLVYHDLDKLHIKHSQTPSISVTNSFYNEKIHVPKARFVMRPAIRVMSRETFAPTITPLYVRLYLHVLKLALALALYSRDFATTFSPKIPHYQIRP